MGEESSEEELIIYTDVLTMLPQETSYGDSSLSKKDVNFSVSVGSSDDLAQLVRNLVDQGNFSQINISSLSLNPESGYSLGLMLSR